MKHEITDHGDPQKYWTQIPNIVYTLGLKPFELTLYNHLKWAAGAKPNGKCTKSTATLAKETGMGTGTVSRAKTELEKKRHELGGKPLIRTKEMPNPKGGKPYQEIAITDIWKANMLKFTSSTEEVDEVEQVPVEVESSSRATSPVEINNNYKQELREQEVKPLSPHARLMDFQQLRTGPIANGARDGKAAKWLLEHGYDPVECEGCFDFLMAQEWRSSAVSWQTVQTNIGAWVSRQGITRRSNGNGHAAPVVRDANYYIAGFEKGMKLAPKYDVGKDIAAIPDAAIREQVNQWWMTQCSSREKVSSL